MGLDRLAGVEGFGPLARRDSPRARGGHSIESPKDIRILLVDDDFADAEHTLEALSIHGLGEAVRIARGGQEALDYLFGHGQFAARRRYPMPDLVLLDLNMPGTDGFAVLRQVRRSEGLRRIPVIALCTSVEDGARCMTSASPADRYIVKPVTVDDLSGLAGWTEVL